MNDDAKKPKSRLRIAVYLNQEEKTEIEEKAKDDCNLSASDYLKKLGLGHQPKSILDQKAILSLLKVNGDQGRLGGLLKQLLTEQGDHLKGKTHRAQVNELLGSLKSSQAELVAVVQEIKTKR